jgi:hypothetical protein
VQGESDDEGRDEDAGDGECHERRKQTPHRAPFEIERGVEDEPGNKEKEHELSRDRGPHARHRLADRDSKEHQRDRLRDIDPAETCKRRYRAVAPALRMYRSAPTKTASRDATRRRMPDVISTPGILRVEWGRA